MIRELAEIYRLVKNQADRSCKGRRTKKSTGAAGKQCGGTDLKFGAGSIQNTCKCEVQELCGSILGRGGDGQIHLLTRVIQLCWGKQSATR